MMKFFNKQKSKIYQISNNLYLLLFSFIFSALNLSLYDHVLSKIIIYLTVQFALNFILLFPFSFNVKSLKFASLAVFFMTLYANFIYQEFGTIIDEMIILNIVQNIDNYSGINIYLLLLYLLFFFTISIIIFKLKISNSAISKKITIALFPIIILSIFVTQNEKLFLKNFFASYAPQNVIAATIQYIKISNQEAEKKIPLTKIYNFHNHNNKNINVVLVIGESARLDHFSLGNYGRKTNPLLSKEKNLLFFKNVTPCMNSTAYAVPCLLSHQSRSEFFDSNTRYDNVISVYKSLGFNTSWFATQSAFGTGNFILQNALQAQNVKMKSSYRSYAAQQNGVFLDEFLLKDLQNSINSAENNFIVLHTNGSHFPLNMFITPNFEKFSPTCNEKSAKNCSKDSIINSYDNTILYTDFFLSQVIKILKNSNAILIYIADHGAFLGEEKKYFHGNKDDYSKQAHQVPMIIWMSDNLLQDKQYKEFFNMATKKINDKLSHDNIFYSLIGCSKISHNISDKDHLNICSQVR